MLNFFIILVSIVAGSSSYLISHKLNKGTVVGSSITALIGGAILIHFFPANGPMLATVSSCASYAGMVSTKNSPNMFSMLIISLLTGIIFIFAQKSYLGIGGRLGTIAGVACLVWIGLKELFLFINLKINFKKK